jgi:hypothetical protein
VSQNLVKESTMYFPLQYKYCTLKAECSPGIAPNKCSTSFKSSKLQRVGFKELFDPIPRIRMPRVVAIQNQGTIMTFVGFFVPHHGIEALWTLSLSGNV